VTRVQQSLLNGFTQRDSRGVLLTASMQVVLYANKPLPDLAEGATAAYRLFIQKFGGSVNWYHARSMRTARKFSAKYAEIFPTLCGEPGLSLPAYQVFGGSGLQDYLPPVFATGYYSAFSWLQLHLLTVLADDPDAVLRLVATLAERFPYRCGHVGYSLCWNNMSVARDIEVPALIGPLLKRYPGVSVGTPGELCDQELPPVNWLTLLGPELLQKLDGLGGVKQALADDSISVTQMGAGVCIRAGETPQLGDVNRKDDLPLYRKVGSYLKDLRGQQEIELDGLDEDESEAWLGRFDS
jgi:Protein of unknown function (DUF3396)